MSLTRGLPAGSVIPDEIESKEPVGRCPFRLRGSVPGRSNAVEGELLRQRGPAPVVELPGGVQARAVVDYGLALRLLAREEVSRDARLHWPGFRDGTRSVDGAIAAWAGTHNALNSYGDDHRRLRAPISAALTPRRVDRMTPQIEIIVDEALRDLTLGEDGVDLVQAYAQRIPQQVMTRLLGVPADLLGPFSTAASTLFDTDAGTEAIHHAMGAILNILGQMVTVRRNQPGDDLVSDLICAADASDNPLSDEELLQQLMLVVIAGTETTVHAIGTFLVHLLIHPYQRELVTEGAVRLEDALEESLRLQPPVAGVPLRYVVRDFEDPETGESFEQGEAIQIHLAAASNDPAVHQRADQFDAERLTARRHLAFGYGPHFCPGASLARREVVIAVDRWLRTFPHARLAVDPRDLRQVPGFIANGFQQIPVRLY
ncbi:cytochrome P450 [Streptomyces olivaceoviridis]|uniref:cytochrome P450 n=1 Tax=Streptomyces olivaceoviridis TaxID=1921 RepID=UPI00331BF786